MSQGLGQGGHQRDKDHLGEPTSWVMVFSSLAHHCPGTAMGSLVCTGRLSLLASEAKDVSSAKQYPLLGSHPRIRASPEHTLVASSKPHSKKKKSPKSCAASKTNFWHLRHATALCKRVWQTSLSGYWAPIFQMDTVGWILFHVVNTSALWSHALVTSGFIIGLVDCCSLRSNCLVFALRTCYPVGEQQSAKSVVRETPF